MDKLADLAPSQTEKRGRALVPLLILSAILAFIAAAGLALGDGTHALDKDILLALREPGDLAEPIGPRWLDVFAVEVTTLGGTPLLTLFALILSGWFLAIRDVRALLLFLASLLGQSVIVQAMKALFGRSRPDLVPHLTEVSSGSFPSGHAASAAAVYLTIAALIALHIKSKAARNYVYAVAIVLAVTIGASRVYLGVHYPTDVVGGLAFGTAWAAIVLIAARKLDKRG